MQSTLESIGQLERRLTMTVPASEIDRQVDDRLKKLARTVRMAGFRPGKAPLKIVAQQYGPQVRSEVIGDAVQRAFSDAVREQNLRIAGYPRFEPRDAGDAGQLAFSATFEIYPEVVPGDISQVTIERSMLTVGEDEVERTLQVLRKQRTQYEEADRAAATGDRVTIDFVGTIDGVEFAGGRAVDHAFVVGEGRMLSDLEAGIVGMARGATKTVPVTFPADYHAAELAGKAADFAVTMKKVEAAQLPEVDAAFAKSLGVADGDLAKMRADIKANVEREVKQRLGANLKGKVMQALLDATKVEVPRALVGMEVERLADNARADLESRGIKMDNLPIDPKIFEAQAQRRVALGLILAEIVKRNDLRAKPEQVRKLIEEHAESYESPSEVVKWFYSQPERLAEFEGLAVEQNVMDWVLQHARVVEKPVAFEQLMGSAA